MQDENVAVEEKDTQEDISVDLSKEEVEDIEGAVEASIAKRETAPEDGGEADGELDGEKEDLDTDTEKKDNASSDDDDVSDDGSDKDGQDSDDDEVSDEMLEKAISLGVPIAEARKLGSELLGSRIAGLEKSTGSQDENEANDDSPSIDELLDGIKDLDPDIYDEELVQGFSTLKQVIRDQAASISKMAKASGDDKITAKLEGIDNAAEALKANPAKGPELTEKINMLTAGYKSIGKDVSESDIFSEAVNSVLGEEIATVAASEKKAKAKKRSGQRQNRPSGGRGEQAPKDALEEAADMLDRKYFDKK
jgi:hypothetical protein